MTPKQWTMKQLNNAFMYGVCRCGEPREIRKTVDGLNTKMELICPKGHPQ